MKNLWSKIFGQGTPCPCILNQKKGQTHGLPLRMHNFVIVIVNVPVIIVGVGLSQPLNPFVGKFSSAC